MKYAIRRFNGNRCILWRLDEDYKYIDCADGYINQRQNTIIVYKNHVKTDVIALAWAVPIIKVTGLSESQISALVHDGMITKEHAEDILSHEI